jgi:hypothetical protein
MIDNTKLIEMQCMLASLRIENIGKQLAFIFDLWKMHEII